MPTWTARVSLRSPRSWTTCWAETPSSAPKRRVSSSRSHGPHMLEPASWILDALPLGVWVATAPEGRVRYVTRAFREILGMDAVDESRIGDAPATYGIFDRAGKPYPVERLPFSQALATGGPVSVDDMVLHRPDGSRWNIRAF